jgi:NADP-dependent 3-hydroxy acid dehydrogenase YdfG
VTAVADDVQYCSTKFALEGWYDCLRQEIAHLNIKCIIFELGFFRTQIMNPGHVKTFRASPISDYDDTRNLVAQFVQAMNGNQPGDPRKAVEVMLDVVKGEGVSKGRAMPERLPIGTDVLMTARKRAVGHLSICNEWEEVIRSTDLD